MKKTKKDVVMTKKEISSLGESRNTTEYNWPQQQLAPQFQPEWVTTPHIINYPGVSYEPIPYTITTTPTTITTSGASTGAFTFDYGKSSSKEEIKEVLVEFLGNKEKTKKEGKKEALKEIIDIFDEATSFKDIYAAIEKVKESYKELCLEV